MVQCRSGYGQDWNWLVLNLSVIGASTVQVRVLFSPMVSQWFTIVFVTRQQGRYAPELHCIEQCILRIPRDGLIQHESQWSGWAARGRNSRGSTTMVQKRSNQMPLRLALTAWNAAIKPRQAAARALPPVPEAQALVACSSPASSEHTFDQLCLMQTVALQQN